MYKKKLSIITVCYNEPDVEKTCESIVNQTWQDFEWIVIDGGSNKETLDVFEKYKDRIDIFVSEPDTGVYNAYNKAIRKVSGENIIFMNSGDSFYNNSVLEDINTNTDFSGEIIYSDLFLTSREQPEKLKFSPKLRRIKSIHFFIKRNLCTQAMIIPTELFSKYGLFDEKYKIASDLERWICFAKNGAKFKYVNVPIAIFETSGISSNKKYNDLHKSERLEIHLKHFTKDEIDKEIMKYSLLERIFSVKDSSIETDKIITIFGLHIRIKKVR